MTLRRTPIHEFHRDYSRRLVEFSGWEMPLHFSSVIEEHHAVRSTAGLFDVSHMGKLAVTAASSELSQLTISTLPERVGVCKYTHLTDRGGRIIDDVIFSTLARGQYLCVCNAGAAEGVIEHLKGSLASQATIDFTSKIVCLAIQGPASPSVLQSLLDTSILELGPFHGTFAAIKPEVVAPPVEGEGWDPIWRVLGLDERREQIYVTTTGYTGEVGFEIFASNGLGRALWAYILQPRDDLTVIPVGLAARDTLRLEKGFLLSGQDFDGRQTPLETGYERLIDWNHDFLGRELLLQMKERGSYSRLMGVKLLDDAIPRRGNGIYKGEGRVGELTSASFSPSLGIGIGLGYLDPNVARPGEKVGIDVRGEVHPAEVVRTPFVRRPA